MTNILTAEEVQFFTTNGYLIVRNVYCLEDISRIRKKFDTWFADSLWQQNSYDSLSIINDIYTHWGELAEIIFSKKYFDIIKDILGEKIIFLPECAVHRNRFTAWHKDTTSQERAGLTFHQSNKHTLLQCGIYFQSNGKNGGGLTVIPATHHEPDRFITTHNPSIFERMILKLKKILGYSVFDKVEKTDAIIDLDSRAGDLVLFDLRIDHRATRPYAQSKSKLTKYAIFNTFGSPESCVKNYQNYLKTRTEPYYQFINQHFLPDILYKISSQNNIEIYY